MTEPTSETTPASSIHLLPEHLIDQIKAGEVIERPASLIKEILENSLDAGATKIDLHIVANGMDLISLTDDGKGMSFIDLPYAFCRHATSKINRFEDLYKLHSYGFRGEALASIGAVAKVTLTSSLSDNSPSGGKILFHGGECLAHDQQDNLPKGTSLYIKDLFYNTPARLKFVKSTQSEKNAIKRIVEAYLLAHPQINFSIKWDDNDKGFFPAVSDQKERVRQVLCHKVKNKELIEIDGNYEGHRVWGYFSQHSTRGHAHKKQYLFANKRIFTDRQIHQTIIRNMEPLYSQGESGHYCLFLEVPENLIDVNVHPNKTQIKFFKLPVITALISSELKKLGQNSAYIGPELPFDNKNSGTPTHTYDLKGQPESSSFWNRITSGEANSSQYRGPRDLNENHAQTNELSTYSSNRFNESQLNHDLISFTFEEKQHILSKSRLINELFKNIESNPQEANFIPLLISEPIEFQDNLSQETEKELLIHLEKKGFLCERLDQMTLALRAIHNGLDLFKSPALVAQAILHKRDLNKEAYEIRLEQLPRIIKSSQLNMTKFMTVIDNSFYSRNFND